MTGGMVLKVILLPGPMPINNNGNIMTPEIRSNLLSVKQIITSTLLSADHQSKLDFLQEMQREIDFLIVAVISNELPDISEVEAAKPPQSPT